MRVVSLNCSNTEIVAALGLSDLLVGVDSDSDWPGDVVARLPRVGRDLDVDVARVAELRPDLVLASLTVPGHERVVADLAAAGLRFHAPETQSLADVWRDVAQIARLLGVPERGEAVVGAMRRAMPPRHRDRRPRLLVEWWPKPVIAAGRRSWVHDLVALAGGCNALDRDVKSGSVADDEVQAMDPHAVVISWCGVRTEKYRPEVVARRPGWETVSAVRHGRVHCVPEAFLGRPGPRLVEGYRQLVRIAGEVVDA